MKGIIAPKLALYDAEAARRILEGIQNEEFRIFAKVDLYDVLPVEDISALSSLSDDGLLLAIAYLRGAKHTDSQARRYEFIENALARAYKSIPHALDDLGLRLAVQFVREFSRFDPIKSLDVSRQIVNAVTTSTSGHLAHLLYGLSKAGYVFTEEEKTALEQMSSLWLMQLEAAAPKYSGMHEQLAVVYSQMGRVLAPVNTDRALQFFENARRHANLETHSILRLRARMYILKHLLMCQDADLWKRAVRYSLEFGEAILETFSWFGHDLIELGDGDEPYKLLQEIHWAENVIGL